MWELAFRLKKAFPSYLQEDIDIIIKNTRAISLLKTYPVNTFEVFIDKEKIDIPVRHCLDEIQPANLLKRILSRKFVLTNVQQNIVDCFYTRHCNGYIRERYLKEIVQLDYEWVVLYVIQLLGEYVIEILQVIYENLNQRNLSNYKKFIKNNSEFYELTRQRMISYWDCYYRRFYKYKKDYVGFKVFKILDAEL
jgi:hypothetical protein